MVLVYSYQLNVELLQALRSRRTAVLHTGKMALVNEI